MQYQKVCVEVLVRFSPEGELFPQEVVWGDGRRFPVDRLLGREGMAAGVPAVLPVRYLCLIGGQERALYFEPDRMRWFVRI